MDITQFREFIQLNEEEYDRLRDRFGQNKPYSNKQIDSLTSGKKYRVGKIYYDVTYAEKDVAKKMGMKWDSTIGAWYLNVYDRNMTWKSNDMFPKPKDLNKFFDQFNKTYKIDFKVKDFDYYKAK